MLPIYLIDFPNDGPLNSKYHGFKDFKWKNPIMKFIDTTFGSICMVIFILSIIIILANLL